MKEVKKVKLRRDCKTCSNAAPSEFGHVEGLNLMKCIYNLPTLGVLFSDHHCPSYDQHWLVSVPLVDEDDNIIEEYHVEGDNL